LASGKTGRRKLRCDVKPNFNHRSAILSLVIRHDRT
jgi:hypothetical protein